MRSGATHRFLWAAGFAFPLLLASCAKGPLLENESALRKSCLITAGGIAGGEVELLKFGHFGEKAPLDCVVAGALPDVESEGDGFFASRLLVLRYQGGTWRIALDAAKWATNPSGYVGVDSLDDSYDFKGLRVVVEDKNPTRQPGITLWISYLDENGEDDGEAKQFSLNPATGRYQEFDDKQGFRPELREPPHVRSK
ncbi:MAG TPA: hypothetical protein VH639_14030 [Bryobacteraceae bacterium]